MPEASWDGVDEVICNQELVHQARGVYGVDLKCAGTRPADVPGGSSADDPRNRRGGGRDRGPRERCPMRSNVRPEASTRSRNTLRPRRCFWPHYLTTNPYILSILRLVQ